MGLLIESVVWSENKLNALIDNNCIVLTFSRTSKKTETTIAKVVKTTGLYQPLDKLQFI